MKQSDAFGKVLALAKQIHLQQPEQPWSHHQFFMGPRNRIGTFVTEWWTTWETHITCEDLVSAIVQANKALLPDDMEAFADRVMDVFKEAVADGRLFDSWKVFTRAEPTLFETIVARDKLTFAKTLYAWCEAKCLDSVCRWLAIYPLHKVRTSTTQIGFSGLWLLDAKDVQSWQQFHTPYPAASTFDVTTGRWLPGMNGPTLTRGREVPTWILCEVTGTIDGARREAARRIKNFVALAFSILGEQNRGVFMKTMWETCDYSIQFAERGRGGWSSGGIGHLIPPIGDDITISHAVIQATRYWHHRLVSATPEVGRRAMTASQFFHQAILESDTQQFLHCFICLDALFGERWRVESEIVRGVRSVFSKEADWVDRCRWLFDLRSELVHGEISALREWGRLASYRRHFRSEPLDDAELTAMRSLRCFFDVPQPNTPVFTYQI